MKPSPWRGPISCYTWQLSWETNRLSACTLQAESLENHRNDPPALAHQIRIFPHLMGGNRSSRWLHTSWDPQPGSPQTPQSHGFGGPSFFLPKPTKSSRHGIDGGDKDCIPGPHQRRSGLADQRFPSCSDNHPADSLGGNPRIRSIFRLSSCPSTATCRHAGHRGRGCLAPFAGKRIDFRHIEDLPRSIEIVLKPDGKSIRWRNSAQWARNTMVNEDGRMKKAKNGIWEISDKGP